ncbi:MAG: SufD family Fe-S cluster assembly protein [Patescibacteria group bacterium]
MTHNTPQKSAFTQLPEFIGQTPATLEIPDNTSKIIITDELQNSQITINSDCNITFVAILKNGWAEPKVLNFNFHGQNSTLNFITIILGTNNHKFPFQTFSNHHQPRNNAYYFVRCAMFDHSEVDYVGNLIIKPKAQITDSYLAHHTLMLSPHAKTRTIPSLEIEADDVKAGHAATVGNIDDELLFYLGSRGINQREAQDLLIQSFVECDLAKIPNKEIQEILAKEIQKLTTAHY